MREFNDSLIRDKNRTLYQTGHSGALRRLVASGERKREGKAKAKAPTKAPTKAPATIEQNRVPLKGMIFPLK
nr:hypothetical protein [uncultured Stomatobaculum sp.]